jgi:hypothetical protein
MTELEAIKSVQDGIFKAEHGLRKIQKLNTKAGRHAASNLAFGFWGEAATLHSRMMASLIEQYPEYADEISVRGNVEGGGGRG